MKKFMFLFYLLPLVFSCISVKTVSNTSESGTNEVWEQGVYTITGEIINVIQDTAGQTITLKDSQNREYSCMVSTENLGENSAQYRKFVPGETIGFRGTLSKSNQMIVQEILEMR